MSTKKIIKGTVIFALSGILCRIMGFIFRIYISRIMPASQIGLYQMVMPICVLGQAIAVGGLSTAVTKYTAAYLAQNKKDKGYVNFLATCLCCTAVSAVIAVIIGKNAGFISKIFLSSNLCGSLLIITAYSLPFACIHTVISSYFVGLELHGLCATAQVIEQVIRITCVFTFVGITEQNGDSPDASTALYGILTGEIASSVFCFIAVIFLKDEYKTEETALSKTPLYYMSEGIVQLAVNYRLALPITANHICLHLMQSFEAVLLPMMLITCGQTNDTALTTYGVLTGMTMPLVLFPATFTNAMSQALLPDISKSWQTKNYSRLNKSMELALALACNLGIMCIPGFLFYGAGFGGIIFDNSMVIEQVRLMSLICPVVFLSTPLSSALNAMGKSGTVFISNMLAQLIRLILIVFIIPRTGISGYCYGLIASHLFVCIYMMLVLKKSTGCSYSLKALAAAPVIRSIICFFATIPIYTSLHHAGNLPEITCLLIGGGSYILACVISYIFMHDIKDI